MCVGGKLGSVAYWGGQVGRENSESGYQGGEGECGRGLLKGSGCEKIRGSLVRRTNCEGASRE